jgi:hypothetical protein
MISLSSLQKIREIRQPIRQAQQLVNPLVGDATVDSRRGAINTAREQEQLVMERASQYMERLNNSF